MSRLIFWSFFANSMMSQPAQWKTILCFIANALLISSCEERFSIPVASIPDKYIIDAQLDNYFGATVSVQKLLPFSLKGKHYEFVKPSKVWVIDQNKVGDTIFLTHAKYKPFSYDRADETEVDFYTSPFKAELGHTYTIEVAVGNAIFKAEAAVPQDSIQVKLDASKYKMKTYFGRAYNLDCNFSFDLKGDSKYAQLAILQSLGKPGSGARIMVASEYTKLFSPNTLFSAGAKSGLDWKFPRFYDTFQIPTIDRDNCNEESPCPPGKEYTDKTRLCFISLNRGSYNNLFSLYSQPRRTRDDDVYNKQITFSNVESPANPASNWSGGALGYFHAYYVTTFPLPEPSPPSGIEGIRNDNR